MTPEFGHYPFAWGEHSSDGKRYQIFSATGTHILGEVRRSGLNWYGWNLREVSIGTYATREAAAQAVAKWGWENVVQEGETTPPIGNLFPVPDSLPPDLDLTSPVQVAEYILQAASPTERAVRAYWFLGQTKPNRTALSDLVIAMARLEQMGDA